MSPIFQFLLHVTGADNVSGPWYGFWSGFGSDLSEIALLGAAYTLYRRHKCTRCWRLSHMKVEGTHFKTCHKHSTASHHAFLKQLHAEKHPEQHAFLNGKEKNNG